MMDDLQKQVEIDTMHTCCTWLHFLQLKATYAPDLQQENK